MRPQRISRINEEVKREMGNILRTLKDPRIPKLISPVRVDVTNDLSFCKVYISMFGENIDKEAAMKALKASAGFVRKEIGERVNLRYTPQIIFIEDDSIEYGAKISKMIDDLGKGGKDD